jgi:hypothetical protein
MKKYKKLVVYICGLLLLIFIFYLTCFHHTEPYETGLGWNVITGQTYLDSSGYHLTPPWILIAKIDTRPMRVCVNSTSRTANCMLVQFNKRYYKEFLKTEGFHYYWWYNRFSINFGYSEEYRGVRDLLRGYAYSVQKYPFIEVKETY